MKPNTACAGECLYENFKLEYAVVSLEFVRNRSLKIEAICYNPYNAFEREAIFKYSTNTFNTQDERLKIALSIIDSVINNLNLPKDKLYKLIVKNHEVFYIAKT